MDVLFVDVINFNDILAPTGLLTFSFFVKVFLFFYKDYFNDQLKYSKMRLISKRALPVIYSTSLFGTWSFVLTVYERRRIAYDESAIRERHVMGGRQLGM